MQKPILFVCTLFLMLVSFSCKKKKLPEYENTGSTGNYQPTTAGSQWSYQVRGTSNYDYTLTATTRDTIIGSTTFRVFENNNDPFEYYSKNGGDYIRFTALPEFNYQPVQMVFLKDYLLVGQEWLETASVKVKVGGINVPVTVYNYISIAEKGIDYTVNGVTFKNVIKVVVKPQIKTILGIGVDNTNDIYSYYAEGVGMIYNKTMLKIPTGDVDMNKEIKLVAYTIK
ncbi:MAG: hypothetical protein U0T11_04810 [Chitinophagaceae bacterium]